MKRWVFIILFLLFVGIVASFGSPGPVYSADGPESDAPDRLIPRLLPLKPFIGKTWRGTFKSSTPAKPMVDVSRWERTLNGRAVRMLHSLNNGEYGGEIIIMWDNEKKSLVFFYFSTAGTFTRGTMKFEDGKLITHEILPKTRDGITEMKAFNEILPDGRMRSKTRFFKNGKWVDAYEVIYVEDPCAKVIFK